MKEKFTIHQLLTEESGPTRSGGVWRRRTVILESEPDAYGNTRKVAATANSDRCDQLAALRPGQAVLASYIVIAREWNDRWYNDVNLVSIQPVTAPSGSYVPGTEDLPI